MNPTAPEPSAPRPGVAVTVRGLRRSLGGRPVLQGISFEVHPGQIFVIMGPSGSGKSVLLRHLIGLETPDEGEILLDQQPLNGTGLLDRYRVAMVFQSGALLNSLTVAENVGLYLAEHRLHTPADIAAVVRDKLAIVGLDGEQHRYPSELSGGMKKRVAIARALAIEPQLLLYDEPTSELDPIMAATIGEEIVHLRQRIGVTSIVVSHDRDLAFGIADRMALIHEGRLLTLGTPDEVRACTDPVVRQFLTAEFRPNPTAIRS